MLKEQRNHWLWPAHPVDPLAAPGGEGGGVGVADTHTPVIIHYIPTSGWQSIPIADLPLIASHPDVSAEDGMQRSI